MKKNERSIFKFSSIITLSLAVLLSSCKETHLNHLFLILT